MKKQAKARESIRGGTRMNRPKQSEIPNNKKNLGELTLPEMEEYYNKQLFVEARELLEYHSYLIGLFEGAKKSKDLATLQHISKELDYCNERMDWVTKKMDGIRKLWKLIPGIIKSARVRKEAKRE